MQYFDLRDFAMRKLKPLVLIFTLVLSTQPVKSDGYPECRADIVAQRFDQALVSCAIGAAQGDTFALNTLGTLYELGLAVDKDHNKAMDYFRLAAEAGDREAQYNLASMYEKKSGRKYGEKVYYWLTKSAEQGHILAAYRLGQRYDRMIDLPTWGDSFQHAAIEARRWFYEAAVMGHVPAMHEVAKLHAFNITPRGTLRQDAIKIGGVQSSDEVAILWFKKAALNGYPPAQYTLGMRYRPHPVARSMGVERDIVTSYMWYYIAALNGHATASQAIRSFSSSPSGRAEISEAQILKATEKAERCIATGYSDC